MRVQMNEWSGGRIMPSILPPGQQPHALIRFVLPFGQREAAHFADALPRFQQPHVRLGFSL